MREILFRGKNPITNEFVIGDLFQHGEQCFIMVLNRNIEVPPETVGQYTGLCDKNGKKIFEGDIIKISNGEIYTVVFEAGGFATGIFSSGFFLGEWDMAHVEVIGNIYDDPELMKTK